LRTPCGVIDHLYTAYTRIFRLNVGGSREKRSVEMLRVNIREKRIFISSENLVLVFLEISLPGNKIMFRREDKCTQVNKLEKLECK